MSAPVAVSAMVVPSQIVGELTVMVGFALTVSVAVVVPVHPSVVPVMVYTVVAAGLPLTDCVVVEANPVAGAQV